MFADFYVFSLAKVIKVFRKIIATLHVKMKNDES